MTQPQTPLTVLLYQLGLFPPSECPGLCRHRPGHSLGEKAKLIEQNHQRWLCLFMQWFSWHHPFVPASTFVNNLFLNTVCRLLYLMYLISRYHSILQRQLKSYIILQRVFFGSAPTLYFSFIRFL